jgi:hypothetical protein
VSTHSIVLNVPDYSRQSVSSINKLEESENIRESSRVVRIILPSSDKLGHRLEHSAVLVILLVINTSLSSEFYITDKLIVYTFAASVCTKFTPAYSLFFSYSNTQLTCCRGATALIILRSIFRLTFVVFSLS